MKLSGKKVAVFGDSIAYGSGNGGFGVGEYLQKDLGLKPVKYAVGGARVGLRADKNWVVTQVIQAVKDGVLPDYIVIEGFTNDSNVSE